jgi:hypothetical protein
MPTLAGRKPSSNNAKGSNDRLSNIGAYNTASSPPNINPTDEANAPLTFAASSAKCSDDGQSTDVLARYLEYAEHNVWEARET